MNNLVDHKIVQFLELFSGTFKKKKFWWPLQITINAISLGNPFITILLAIDGIGAALAGASAALSVKIPATTYTSAD
jgi:hypothetical protein